MRDELARGWFVEHYTAEIGAGDDSRDKSRDRTAVESWWKGLAGLTTQESEMRHMHERAYEVADAILASGVLADTLRALAKDPGLTRVLVNGGVRRHHTAVREALVVIADHVNKESGRT